MRPHVTWSYMTRRISLISPASLDKGQVVRTGLRHTCLLAPDRRVPGASHLFEEPGALENIARETVRQPEDTWGADAAPAHPEQKSVSPVCSEHRG